MSKYYIFDTETDGHEEQGLVQLACADNEAINRPERDLNSDDSPVEDLEGLFVEYVRPAKKQRAIGVCTHGLTDEFLSQFQNGEIVYNYIINTMIPSDDIFVAHNIQFDIDVVNTFLKRCEKAPFYNKKDLTFNPRGLDTLRLPKHFIKQSEIGSYKLDALFVYLFPEKVKEMFERRNSHDALEDCKMTDEVLMEIGRRYMDTEDIEELYLKSLEPYEVDDWYLGKYRGQPLEAAKGDHGYLKWARKDLVDDHPDLIYSLDKKGI